MILELYFWKNNEKRSQRIYFGIRCGERQSFNNLKFVLLPLKTIKNLFLRTVKQKNIAVTDEHKIFSIYR